MDHCRAFDVLGKDVLVLDNTSLLRGKFDILAVHGQLVLISLLVALEVYFVEIKSFIGNQVSDILV